MTQKDVARLMSITEVSVSRWIKGHRVPNKETLTKLAAILNCNMEDFYAEEISDLQTSKTLDSLTIEEWKARAERAENELAILKAHTPSSRHPETAEEYLARLRSSMRFVFNFITQDEPSSR